MSALAYQRTKEWLESKGWHTWRWETWNSWSHTRLDGYGLIDITAIRHDSPGVWGVNACTDNGEVAAHIDKYLSGWDHPKKGRMPPNPHLPVWLSAGNRFSIMGWGTRCYELKSGKRSKQKVYTLRLIEFYLSGAEVKFKEIETEIPEL